MSTVIRTCDQCKGQKQVMGFGLMQYPCNQCNGVGYREVPIVAPEAVMVQDAPAKPKRIRKRKPVDETKPA